MRKIVKAWRTKGNRRPYIDIFHAMRMRGDVVIPDTMTEICGSLFAGNAEITSFTVPGTVKRIGVRAFANCTGLKEVQLNEGIETIEDNAFTGCDRLKRVVYPDSVTQYSGHTFWNTRLTAPVLNASGTVLVYCPSNVFGPEWTVPDTVKIIAREAFSNNETLKTLHLPEGLEIIGERAFMACGLREIVLPASVRKVGDMAFWECGSLRKAVILNPETRVPPNTFCDCGRLREIQYGSQLFSDRFFHLKGLPFLTPHMEDEANLDHASQPRFHQLAARCAQGEGEGMAALAEWFEGLSRQTGASPFYLRAANYWRYRAYRQGNAEAAAWFARFFREHPGEHLDAVLPENGDSMPGHCIHAVPGKLLNDLGYLFFAADRAYDLEQREGEELVTASAYASYDPPDEDGFGAEYNYDWWFLDGNMQPIPGVHSVTASLQDMIQFPYFNSARRRAIRALEQRKENREHHSHTDL